jgi:hypothetical protein
MDLDNILPFKLDASYLLASVLWSGIGVGFWVYGKKQRSAPPLVGGIALIAVSCLITSAFWMSLTCIGIIVGIYYWSRQED